MPASPSGAVASPPVAGEAAQEARPPRWLAVVTVGTGALCGLSAVILGTIGQTEAAIAAGGVGAAAFAALGGASVTINIRK
ncbi:hypothetical protein [Streptomyces laurentii]|uniref:hypothetical protein n=1 Tax=Streptomyces laurentii TaxID=39478 RepID=UPI00368A70DA